jgi:hypothetical protein
LASMSRVLLDHEKNCNYILLLPSGGIVC